MPKPISAVDAISPAFTRTKRILLGPFRFSLWARLAVVAIVTGETSGGGGEASIPSLNTTRGGDDHWRAAASFLSEPDWQQIQPYLSWIILGALVVLALILLWIYSDCVYRFILLESVITGKCELREGWRRWRDAGRRYFAWAIAYAFGALVAVSAVIGIPVLLAYRAGWFEKSEQHTAGLIGGVLLLLLIFLALVAVLALIDLFARDFLVPVMAFENVNAMHGWRRLMPIVGAEKLSFAGYVLMKIVLAMGSAMIFTIVNVIVVLVTLIPLVLIGVAGYFIGRGAGITWDMPAILFVTGVGMLAVAAILYVVGFVYAPGLVFFEAYTVEFFAARYQPLANSLNPPIPPAAPSIAPASAGESLRPPEPSTA